MLAPPLYSYSLPPFTLTPSRPDVLMQSLRRRRDAIDGLARVSSIYATCCRHGQIQSCAKCTTKTQSENT